MSASPQVERFERGAGLDVLMVIALGCAGLVPLASTFAGWEWFVVGGGAVVTASVIVWQFRINHWSSWLLAILLGFGTAVGAVVVTSGPSALASLVVGQSSFDTVVRSMTTGWGELIQTLPRVDPSGPVLVVPLILGLLPSAGSAMLALYSNQAVLPLLPHLVTLAVVIPLGRGEHELVYLGLGIAVLAVLWAAQRQGRIEARRPSLTTIVARTMTLLIVLLLSQTAAQGFSDRQPHLFRQSLAEGMDTTAVPTLLDGFRRYTHQPLEPIDNVNRRRLLTVLNAPAKLRLRFAALDWYDGVGWRPNPQTQPSASTDRYLRMGTELDNPSAGREVTVQVKVRPGWHSPWVPVAGQLQGLGFYGTEEPDVRYNLATSTALMTRWLKRGQTYWFTARLPDNSLKPSMKAAQGVDPDLYERAAFLDEIAAGFRDSNNTPMQALLAAAKTLKRKGAYSDGAEGWERKFKPGHGAERLGINFLFAPQVVGNDEQYAAALALIGVRLKIPTRVVVGAVVPRNGIVRGRHVEAWVEVQIEDGSWHILPPSEFIGTKKPKRHNPPREQARPVITPTRKQVREHQQQMQSAQDEQQKPKPSPTAREPRSWWWLLALLLAGALGSVPGSKVVRTRLRRGRGGAADRMASGWREVTDWSRDLGVSVEATASRPRQALQADLPRELGGRADVGTFGKTLEEAEVAEYWADVERAVSTLKRRHPRWRQVLAWFNPGSLIRR